jgi:hypothetical protein
MLFTMIIPNLKLVIGQDMEQDMEKYELHPREGDGPFQSTS